MNKPSFLDDSYPKLLGPIVIYKEAQRSWAYSKRVEGILQVLPRFIKNILVTTRAGKQSTSFIIDHSNAC